ncbi:MAG TPA: NAD(+) diphosphatase [Streptosporangiaceae bacterium]|nr:NAD(+) diphosphatase [Streptosporangiaceae bacterium]
MTETPALLGRLALGRAAVDRATARRTDSEWLAAAWRDPRTRVLVVENGRALVRLRDGGADLVLVPTAQAPEGTRFLLGTGADGTAYFGVSAPLASVHEAAGGSPPGDGEPGQAVTCPASLRQVGALLPDRDAGLLTHAVALANWHDSHTHCPRCGTPTRLGLAGHSAVCPADGTEHFPRTDPAVIMLVTDPDDRCLLARNASWPDRRVSILAGFVEPGESAEQAVAREVREETGIAVSRIAYLGSQPWPMPRSLMLGFRAFADTVAPITVDAEEIAEARWYSRDGLLAALEAREIGLPPPVSIARRIIESWYGAELPSGVEFR